MRLRRWQRRPTYRWALWARRTAPTHTHERLCCARPGLDPINISTAKRRAAAPRVAALYEKAKLTLTLKPYKILPNARNDDVSTF